MRLSSLAIILFLSGQAKAATISSHHCDQSGSKAVCRIQLEGTVDENDRLFLSRVHDRDLLTYQGVVVGSTGKFLGKDFHAGFFPRVYPLSSLHGEKSPLLILEASAGLLNSPGIPVSAKVKVIDANYPLWKILGPPILKFTSFCLLIALAMYQLSSLRFRTTDGWIYPRDELRWMLGSFTSYLLLRHEVSELFVPLLWSQSTHIFAQRASISVALWALTLLLLNGRYSDRSCIERTRQRGSHKTLSRLADFALLLSLFLLSAFPGMNPREATSLLALPLIPLIYALGRCLQDMEWQRVFKRSSKTPLTFHLCMMLVPVGALTVETLAVFGGKGDQLPLEVTAWAVLLFSGLRIRSFMVGRERSRLLATDCRLILMQHARGSARLQALCEFVGDEWGAARISVISVEDEAGLVLASAGPEAIPHEQREDSRRLGPFLRRVCKQGQMLYAPVAEELGKDLQSQGLKHSSLAIPLSQESKVRAVVCMMADEGERIPPNDAGQLELLVETLTLEILSAVAQHVAENRNLHLLNIARRADALAVEHLDHWGHFHQSKEPETRVVLGGDCIPASPFLEQLKTSPVFGKTWAAYRAEVRSVWTAIATSYEFIPKDNRDDFWVISPKQFRNPLLQELGAERVAILIATALRKHTRAISSKQAYSALGYCGVRLACSTVNLRQSSWHGSAVEIDSDQFSLLLELRQRAIPGTILFHGPGETLSAENRNAFSCLTRPWFEVSNRKICSILHAAADKKEVRKIESQALEKVRAFSRKAA